jgi:DHA2 family multidrug resistance protein
MQSAMKNKMIDAVGMNATVQSAPLKSLYFRIQNQVFMMSFLQLIVVIMVIFSFSFIPLYFLKFKKKPQAVMDSH